MITIDSNGGLIFLGIVMMIVAIVWLGRSGGTSPDKPAKKHERKRRKIEIDGVIYEEVGKKPAPKTDYFGRIR